MNEEVRALLDHYLDPKVAARGAVLLTGPWGAGKTHFIKDYMGKRDDDLKKADPLNGPGHLYASLYGVSSFDEVQTQFFAQTNPALNSGPVRLLGTLTARALNTVARGQVVKSEDANVIRKFLARSIDGLALVFDDLERCALPIVEMMGFINTFVEHEGAKVIVLASEGDIPPTQTKEYWERKEKLVAKTLEVRADPDAVYDIFLNGMRHTAARKIAADAKAAALRTFNASDKANLRSLRAALEDFDRLVGGVDPRLAESPQAMERLLLFSIATTMELRAGSIVDHEVSVLCAATHRLLFSRRAKGHQPGRLEELAAISNKYNEVEWTDGVVPPEALAKLFVSGVLDRAAIDASLAQHPLVVGPAKTPAWRRIWQWFDMSKSEYAEVRRLFLDDLAAGAIVHPGQIMHSAGSIIQLRERGDDLLKGCDVIEYFRNYLQRCEAGGTLIPDIDPIEGLDGSGWAGLSYPSVDTEEFQAVRKELEASVRRASAARMKSEAPSLLEALRTGKSYEQISEYGRAAPNYGGVAILHFLEPAKFADLCLQDGKLDERLVGALFKRYHSAEHSGDLAAEGPWVRKLKDELLQRVSAEPPPFHSRLSGSIRHWFDQMEAALGLPPATSKSAAGARPKPKPTRGLAKKD